MSRGYKTVSGVMSKPRLFLIDPMCVLDYGHNPQSLLYFGRYFTNRGFDVQALVCRVFPLSKGEYARFKRSTSYYYSAFIPLKGSKPEALRNTHVDAGPDLGDPLETLAVQDMKAILRDEAITADDYIFYPSVDYYGVCGLLRVLKGLGKRAPQVHLRYIGVMENGTHYRTDRLKYMRLLIEQSGLGDRLTISAESPVYALELTKALQRPVGYTLYPLEPNVSPLPKSEPFVVFSAGAGREDKGFSRMFPIARLYRKLHPDEDVRFMIQNVPPTVEQQHEAYVSQLYAAPNVEVIPSALSDEEMAVAYRRSHFLIMPYDYEVYRYRGSAVFMEGISQARPFAISAGTGFHPLVEGLPTAFNCATDRDFVDRIHAAVSEGPAKAEAAAKKTARIYANLAKQQLDAIWQEDSQ